MSKNKLAKFADMDRLPHVFQYPYAVLQQKGFYLKGEWNKSFFKNNNPIVLELGCGKGEYTVGLAKLFPDKNFIGVDIKGARMWTGATDAQKENLSNVAFLRTHIELLESFFATGEVAEIWITFPDPQMTKVNKRMTSTRFMQLYQKFLRSGGIIHLKTDSNFMYLYTDTMIRNNNLSILFQTDNLYDSALNDNILGIQTFYEKQWIDRGLTIKYLKFELSNNSNWIEPDVEIEQDSYRSFGRNNSQTLTKLEKKNTHKE